jgi:hypothetical protein
MDKRALAEQAVCFFALLLLMCLRCIAVVGSPYLFAEDSSIFIARAIDSEWNALVTPYAGYFHLVAQLTADIAWKTCDVFNNATLLPYLLNIPAVLIATAILCYFTNDTFAWIVPKRRNRLICIGIALCFITYAEMFWNITYLQWWMGFYFFLVGLDTVHRLELPNWRRMSILFLFGLSCPQIVLLLPVFGFAVIYRLAKKTFVLSDGAKSVCILLPCIVQTISAIQLRIAPGASLSQLPVYIKQAIMHFFDIAGRLITPKGFSENVVRNAVIGLVLLCILIGYCVYNAVIQKTLTKPAVFAVFSVCWAGMQYMMNVVSLGKIVSEAGRYCFVPLMVIGLLFAAAVMEWIPNQTGRAVLLCFFMIVCVPRFEVPLSAEMTAVYRQFSSLYERNAARRLRIDTAPYFGDYHWFVPLPVPEYTENDIGISYSIESMDNLPVNSRTEQIEWIKVTGWAYDTETESAFAYLLADDGVFYYPLMPLYRSDIAEERGLPGILQCGFYGYLPASLFTENIPAVRIVGIHADNTAYGTGEFILSVSAAA